jgi:hypothetical protein
MLSRASGRALRAGPTTDGAFETEATGAKACTGEESRANMEAIANLAIVKYNSWKVCTYFNNNYDSNEESVDFPVQSEPILLMMDGC